MPPWPRNHISPIGYKVRSVDYALGRLLFSPTYFIIFLLSCTITLRVKETLREKDFVQKSL